MRAWAILLVLLLIAPAIAQSRDASDRPSQRQTDASAEGEWSGTYVQLAIENGTLSYWHQEVHWFDVAVPGAEWNQRGRQATLTTDDGVFRFTDTKNGHVSYKGAPVRLEWDARQQETNRGTLLEKEGHVGLLQVRESDHFFFTFHVKEDQPDRPELAQALEDRRLAGRVHGEEVETYDDVDITVEAPAKATRETPYRVVIGAELEEGRTLVLDVDADMLVGSELELRYFDLNDDGTETEVVFRQASSLEDVLEPTDDAGQPEYWVVKDENGWQVMVSIPHWSTHVVTLASIGNLVQPQVWLGLSAAIALTGLAGFALFRKNRETPPN